ncbi:MAG TPA: D-alanyl-D-alanine carboxypeptidase/D-alanyl-D-alanine-endopeptidase, partial [Clostridia bacterium]|nr:D-alanyl-D-alanine carboxypeptidase/D-alanyl-D-alanine-endopeptidase [Clostridia bacterium]
MAVVANSRLFLIAQVLSAVLLLQHGFALEPNPPATLTELQQRIVDHVSQRKFSAALWGVKIVSLDTGRTLFEHNAGKLFSPASNAKLYTTALALDRLGPDYRIRTSLYAAARPNRRGALEGDLILYGRGDPTISARLHHGDLQSALMPLVTALTNSGVKRIQGDLVGDTSFFRGAAFGAGWAWDDLGYYYGAEVSPLTINDNTLPVTVRPGTRRGAPCEVTVAFAPACLTFRNRTETIEKGGMQSIQLFRSLDQNVVYVSGRMPMDDAGFTEPIPVRHPAELFISMLQEVLGRYGIQVKGRLRTVNWLDRQVEPMNCARMVELGATESLSMSQILREVQKISQNLYTDLLLAHIGEHSRIASDDPNLTSEELGIRELNKFLAEAGVQSGEVLFEEGSGLSRNNLTTPNATVALL